MMRKLTKIASLFIGIFLMYMPFSATAQCGPGEDMTPPTAVCQDVTLTIDASNTITINGFDLDGGSTDNCPGDLAFDPEFLTFDCADVGTTTPITLIVEDLQGNTSTCVSMVTVTEDVPPTAVCADATVSLDAAGMVTITGADVDGGSSDNCTGVTLDVSPDSFTCADIGPNTVTLTVTDDEGNTASCMATVTVEDNTPPVAMCQDITVDVAGGAVAITGFDVNDGSTDNCDSGALVLAVNVNSVDCADVGSVIPVTLTVGDLSGNESTCVSMVTVIETTPPVAVCVDVTVELDANGMASVTTTDIDGGSSDNCAIATLGVNPGNFDCSDIGANTVTLTVTDVGGNTATCMATVTVEDNTPPTAVCQDITVSLDAAGNATIVASDVNGGSADNCGSPTLSVDITSFDCSNVGPNTVTLTATDGQGATAMCMATVTVEDSTPPTITCVADIVVPSDPGVCTANVTFADPTFSDNCPGATIALTGGAPSGTDFAVGTTIIEFTATDASGNTSTCSFNIIVEDMEDPTTGCQDITVELDASGNATITAADVEGVMVGPVMPLPPSRLKIIDPACPAPPVSMGNCDCPPNFVAVGYSGLVGNSYGPAVVSQFTLQCRELMPDGSLGAAVVMTCSNGSLASGVASGPFNAAGDEILVGIQMTMDCGVNALRGFSKPFSEIQAGDNNFNSNAMTVLGGAGGTPASTQFAPIGNVIIGMEVFEDSAPLAAGDAGITAGITLRVAPFVSVSQDNCGIASLTVDPSAFTCADIGANTVTLTATDDSGNTSTCEATVTVEDNIAPTAVCQDITVQLDATGSVMVSASVVNDGSTDNCGDVILGLSPDLFTCANLGPNNATLSVTDMSGNVTTCMATVTVEDNVAPTVDCSALNVTVSTDPGVCTANVTYGAPVVMDNCPGGSAMVTNGGLSGTDFPLGVSTVEYTATDAQGNTATCSFTITVEDTEDPTAVCADITVQLDAAGMASIIASDIDGGSTDNCNIASLNASILDFTCADVGANTVVLTVTDDAGNTATCESTVTVEDNIPPVPMCSDITVQLDAAGMVSILPADINNMSQDNCVDVLIGLSQQDFTCADIGVNTVVLNVTDMSGNAATCEASVTVEDVTPPTALCMDVTVSLDAAGAASITTADIDNGSFDECTTVTLGLDVTDFTCADVGANTVVLTVTDTSGNTSTCEATVTVEDNIAPTAVCQDITVELDAMGEVVIIASDLDGGSTDNCDLTFTADPAILGCDNIGITTVILTVTDTGGNTATCEASVTVQDNIAPMLTCPGDITMDNDPGRCSSVVCFTVEGEDNCDTPIPTSIPGYEFLGVFQGHSYFTVSSLDAVGWEQAHVNAASLGGYLVSINSSDEQDFLESVIGSGSYWIGLRYSPALDEFKWVNGDPLTFEAWGPGQPGGPIEGDYVFTFQFTGNFFDGWYDWNGEDPTRYIVEFDENSMQLVEGLPSGASYPVGVTTVSYRKVDAMGNEDMCTFNVTVLDVEAPVIDCPADMEFDLSPFTCDSIITFDVLATDNCPVTLTQTDMTGLSSGDAFPTGTTILSYEAVDESGNVTTCTFSITLNEYDPGALTCRDINLSLNENCVGSVDAAMVLTNQVVGCLDNYVVELYDDGVFVGNDVDVSYLGRTLTYTVYNPEFGIECWGEVFVEDKLPPTLSCSDDVISCVAGLDAAVLPVISDNCSGAELVLINLTQEVLECDPLYIGRVTRTFIAVDAAGNESDPCTQEIFLERTDLSGINFPISLVIADNSALECSSGFAVDANGNPAPSVAGVPTLNGISLYPFEQSLICNGYVQYSDTDLGSTSCVRKIMRTWEIGEWWCGSANRQLGVQLIEVVDTNGPVVIPPAPLEASTRDFFCSALVDIPPAIVSDACNEPVTVDVIYEGGFINDSNGGEAEIGVGTSTITYVAYDACGNSSSASTTIIVRDNLDPVAVCEQFTTTSVTIDGMAYVGADDLDDGSFDECGDVTLQVRRMTDPCGISGTELYADQVAFCCADVGNDVMVELLVTDLSGNTNICMVQVEVQDKIRPHLTCPADLTVECTFTYDVNSLDTDFGAPTVQDNCPANNVIIETVTEDRDQCGIGTLRRDFSIEDENGVVVTSCFQIITFENPDPFVGTDIDWPEDFDSTDGCSISDLDPDNLPLAFARPVFTEDICDQVGMTYEDEVISFVNGAEACFKIIRTWYVKDWCQRLPDGTFATWIHQQVLKVTNTSAPVVLGCTDQSTCSFAANCGPGFIELIISATDDCTPSSELLYSYRIDAFSDGSYDIVGNGSDASDNYPVGAHTIEWTVWDQCGNFTVCTHNFEIISCTPPVPYCLTDISTELIGMDTDGDGEVDAEMVIVTPDLFDVDSYHPCGYPVVLSFSQDVNDTIRVFDCDDIGIQPIEMWVTDINGNQDFCATNVDIQDNNDTDICPSMLLGNVQGRIYTEQDEEVENVKVRLEGSEQSRTTDETGTYSFPDMPMGGAYTVNPGRVDNPKNGVSTLDVVLIQRHILGLQSLNSPYQYVAADVDNNERISGGDVISLRKLVLGVYEDFPNNTSWRFIDAAAEFADEEDPWYGGLLEQYEIDHLNGDMEIDFIGVKVGDINGDVTANARSANETDVRGSNVWALSVQEQELTAGQEVVIDITADKAENVFGWQHTLEFRDVEVKEVISGRAVMNTSNFRVTDNLLAISYSEAHGISLEPSEVLYSIKVVAKRTGSLSEMLQISDRIVRNESYMEGMQTGTAELNWRPEGDSEGVFTLHQNRPNPWLDKTEILFEIPSEGAVDLKVRDVTGRILFSENRVYGKGAHTVTLDSGSLPSTGVLIYEMRFEDQIATRKMILLK